MSLPDGSGYSDLAGSFVQDGRIQYAALFGAVLGSAWLVGVGAFITIHNAIVTVQVRLLETLQTVAVGFVNATLGGGAELSRQSWGVAFQAISEQSVLIAPTLMALEIVLVYLILGTVARRQELI